MPTATKPCELFVLGAYPSALHVRWTPPPLARRRPVKVLPIDNEPEPFWDGTYQYDYIAKWAAAVGWVDTWGTVAPVGRLNGISGQWVNENVLKPLRVDRSEAWITDCLNTYRASDQMRFAIEHVYAPFAVRQGLPKARLDEHPSENRIVSEAIAGHLPRLRHELADAQPLLVVTLGNAALRVLRRLSDERVGPPTLSLGDGYGQLYEATVGGQQMTVLPLAHPAAPTRYQLAHQRWMATVREP